MQEPIVDFNQLVTDISQTRSFLGKTAETMSGKMREQFDTLLGAIDENFESFKKEVPQTKATFETKVEELTQRHEKNVTDLANLEAKMAEMEEQMENGELPGPEAPPETPVDIKLGSELRDELLSKFLPHSEELKQAPGVAWQDWNLDGSWLSNNLPGQ